MMNKRSLWTSFFVVFGCIYFFSGPILCAEPEKADATGMPHYRALRSLEINRSLLSKAESEYVKLTTEEKANPSSELAVQIEKARYKIKALEEDAVRLQTELPSAVGADEFLKDLVDQHEKGPHVSPVIDHEKERKIETQLQDIYRLHERALDLVRHKKFSEAARVYEEIILISPDDDEAYLLLGHTYLMGTKYQKAAQAFRNAMSIDPENSGEITPFYQNIIIENPEDDVAYSHLGYAWMLLGNATESEKAFIESLRINPENTESRAGLAELASYSR